MKCHHGKRNGKCRATGKVLFVDEDDAIAKVDKYEQIKRYYKCEYCGAFHLTSKPTMWETLQRMRKEFQQTHNNLSTNTQL